MAGLSMPASAVRVGRAADVRYRPFCVEDLQAAGSEP